MNDPNLVCRRQLGDVELLCLPIREELVYLTRRIRLDQFLLMPVLGSVELLL